MMTVRTQRRLLWLTTALTLGVSGWVAWRTFTIKPTAQQADAAATSGAIVEPVLLADRHPVTADQLQPYWSRPLRRPLYDPPPKKEEKPKFVPPPLKVKLLGTIMEPGNAQAILMTSNGEVVMQRAGDTVEGAVIQEVTSTAIKVLYHDQTLDLKVSEE